MKCSARARRGGRHTPQLSRDVVCKLYHKAKAEGVPMTVLANRLVKEALGNKKQINTQRVMEDRNIKEPNRGFML